MTATCVLCEFPLESIKYNLQEQTVAGSFSRLLHVLQYAVGEEVSLQEYYICVACYNLLNALEKIELKAKEIKERLCELYQNYKKKQDVFKQEFDLEELPLQDISDSLIKEKLEDETFTIQDVPESSKPKETAINKTPLHCSICDRHFVYKTRYEAHLKNYHLKSTENTISYSLDKVVAKSLEENLKQFGADLVIKEEEINILNAEESPDENQSAELRRRMQNISGCRQDSGSGQEYQCPYCPKAWKTHSRLKAHLATHKDGTPFMCEICGQAYKHKAALDVHLGMHNGIHPYTCTYCHKSFTQKGGLMRHVAIHTGEKLFQCDLCGKRFVHHTSFSIHKLSHTGEKAYKCDVCGLALMSGSHLKRHMRVHTGEKKFSCGICGKRFAERYNLVSHEKLHNNTGPTAQRKKYRCQICNVAYDQRHKLEGHLTTSHNLNEQQVQTLGCNIFDERNQLTGYGNEDCLNNRISTLLTEHT